MIQITPHMRILVAINPVDFRKGIDGLAGTCRRVLKSDPFSGTVFVFRNRLKTALKILIYDGQGFWLCQKRLSKGRFKWWPGSTDETVHQLAVHELQLMLVGADPSLHQVAPDWKRLPN
ncbi:MAG: IS66 family insertion sequence element accessory protein TnpB [Deltaproteobacteria bacterium]|jgi:transposase|nr:IS66 family insertion sequence element accessory protein TnpB [Deltaproteobacteria bacterium]MBT4285861.1 IS66 family insertion sequence element accessory protein TnpB [Deltaproteobacteria bacterium]MBT6612399.1 IS66 family insertion sequence element accessory protein TnpB [Deltaproteobacteria bacterium]MBT7483348.1 IS66 family insertion sequence element accessory protein TnpB [Candidatus Peregrinibacteria bacterium]